MPGIVAVDLPPQVLDPHAQRAAAAFAEPARARQIEAVTEDLSIVAAPAPRAAPSGQRILAPTMGPVGDTSPVAARSRSA